jgi:hypothetical protein
MKAATRQILALLNATGKIDANEMEEEAGIPYCCRAKRTHSHHNDDVLSPNSNFRESSTTPSVGPRSPPPPTARVASRENGDPSIASEDKMAAAAKVFTLAAASVSLVGGDSASMLQTNNVLF